MKCLLTLRAAHALCFSFDSTIHFHSSVFTHRFINITDHLFASYFKRPPHFHSNILLLITMGTTVFLSFKKECFRKALILVMEICRWEQLRSVFLTYGQFYYLWWFIVSVGYAYTVVKGTVAPPRNVVTEANWILVTVLALDKGESAAAAKDSAGVIKAAQ